MSEKTDHSKEKQKALFTVLRDTFKLDEFRPLQKDVIDHFLRSGSALVIMPTGSGKSLTYQLPSVMLDGPTLVISPLKALMKDQVDKLRALGIQAAFINSDLSRPEREKRQQKFARGEYKILYVTPERFQKPDFLTAVASSEFGIARLVVDEAHCISQWGQDFRPEYAKVGLLRERLKNPATLALTATATPEVRADILRTLNIESAPTFSLPISRPNLAIEVDDVSGIDQKVEKIAEILAGNENVNRDAPCRPAIVYFALITTLHKVSEALHSRKIKHVLYHGDLPEKMKRRSQEDFLSGREPLILATPAFGLGVDKPDVRTVIHAEVPGSIEAYFQEIGRGGRDGEPARCVLLYDQDDVTIQMEFIEWANPDGEYIRKIMSLIASHSARFRQEGADFLREQMSYFNKRDYRVETALNLLRSWGILEEATITGELTDDLWNDEIRAERKRHQQQKLLKLVQWVNSRACRQQTIYKYFGEADGSRCGICDNCLARGKL